MSSLTLGLNQTCMVLSSTQDQKLEYSSGSAEFTEGATLTGAISGAAGTVKTVLRKSGSWAGGDASGFVILSDASGTFQAETISDDEGGNATASGPTTIHTNGVGTPQITTTSTPYSCRFSHANRSGGSIISQGSGEHVVSEPILFLPADAVVQEGDLVTSSETGYNHTYRVTAVQPLYNFFSNTVHHYEAEIKAVEKNG